MTSAVILGDTHFPYANDSSVDKSIRLIEMLKPRFVFQIGDLYDFFHFSSYPKSMISFTPGAEVRLGRKYAERLWQSIQRVSPKTRCFQLTGNHDSRPYKRLLEKAPELEPFHDHEKLFVFDGVKTIFDEREEFIVKMNGYDVCFMHGHRSKLGDHMLYNQMSTVVGHSHLGGVVYKRYKDETRFELNAGYLADPNAGPLQYGAQTKRYWTHGVGIIDKLGPRFFPF